MCVRRSRLREGLDHGFAPANCLQMRQFFQGEREGWQKPQRVTGWKSPRPTFRVKRAQLPGTVEPQCRIVL